MAKSKFLSKIDLYQVYQTKYSFDWTCMHFGIKNAPAAFRRFMDHVFNNLRDFTDVYIDGIVILSDTYYEHLKTPQQGFVTPL